MSNKFKSLLRVMLTTIFLSLLVFNHAFAQPTTLFKDMSCCNETDETIKYHLNYMPFDLNKKQYTKPMHNLRTYLVSLDKKIEFNKIISLDTHTIKFYKDKQPVAEYVDNDYPIAQILSTYISIGKHYEASVYEYDIFTALNQHTIVLNYYATGEDLTNDLMLIYSHCIARYYPCFCPTNKLFVTGVPKTVNCNSRLVLRYTIYTNISDKTWNSIMNGYTGNVINPTEDIYRYVNFNAFVNPDKEMYKFTALPISLPKDKAYIKVTCYDITQKTILSTGFYSTVDTIESSNYTPKLLKSTSEMNTHGIFRNCNAIAFTLFGLVLLVAIAKAIESTEK